MYRDDTLAAHYRACFLKVRDVVEAAVSETTLLQVAQKLQKTRDSRLTGDPVKPVEVLANRYTVNDTEQAGVLRHLIVEGDLSAGNGQRSRALLAQGRRLRPCHRARGAEQQTHRAGPWRLEGVGPRCMRTPEGLQRFGTPAPNF